MTEGERAFYVARARIEKLEGVHRRAYLSTGQVADMGVHGTIKAHYGLHGARDLPLPVDWVVAATGT